MRLRWVFYVWAGAGRRALGGDVVGGASEASVELAFAIGHEVGNHLGGIRLQAHLLDDDLDARSMAEASILIDDLAGRSGSLLTLLRPLISPAWRTAGSTNWGNLLGRVQQQIVDQGTHGTCFSLSGDLETTIAAPDHEWIHPLLITLLDATIAHVGRAGAVLLDVTPADEGVRILIDDDGEEEDLGVEAALRGRPLAVAIGRELLSRIGGRVEVDRSDGRTRVAFVFPTPD